MNPNPVIALAGNPNVGKSTVFNELTGLRQHTGNWPGKTVACARGEFTRNGKTYTLVDLPGTYSLMAHSAEEEIARDFIYKESPDAVIVVCDATCLERNLNLALQIRQLTGRGILCVNLCDEARRKGIEVDFDKLSGLLRMPVIPCSASIKEGIEDLSAAAVRMCETPRQSPETNNHAAIETKAIETIPPDESHENTFYDSICQTPCSTKDTSRKNDALAPLQDEQSAVSFIREAEEISAQAVSQNPGGRRRFDNWADRLATGPRTGILLMFLLLMGIFWLTITGSNYPSQLLSQLFFRFQDILMDAAIAVRMPVVLREALILGIYRVLAWVVSVMLPPMAIFFPLFTILEDLGYLPRVAFNLDYLFKKCSACGKQALTMCMGLGCNAVGVTGCRIIDSPRERLIAVLTNSFMPCNGRFPTLLALITIFFTGSAAASSLWGAALLALLICLGIFMTFGVSWLLSKTVLKGMPSSFTLELPPYRRPQIGRILIRSILDRTLFVLGRAVAIAAPAGLLIWLLANIYAGGQSLLQWGTAFLDPLGRLMGMDGVILAAFILGFPANEIVIPIILMCYLSTGTLVSIEDYTQLQQIFTANGWTWVTALCTILFSLMHWPCSTTCLTMRKETGSWKWTLLGILIPTLCGFVLCTLVHGIAGLL